MLYYSSNNLITIVVFALFFILFLYGMGALGSHTYDSSVIRNVISAQCLPIGHNLYDTTLTITNVDTRNTIPQKVKGFTNQTYQQGNEVTVYFNKSDNTVVSLTETAPCTKGSSFLIVLSFLILAVPYIYHFMKYE